MSYNDKSLESLLYEIFDAVYGELLEASLVSLSDELQTTWRIRIMDELQGVVGDLYSQMQTEEFRKQFQTLITEKLQLLCLQNDDSNQDSASINTIQATLQPA